VTATNWTTRFRTCRCA